MIRHSMLALVAGTCLLVAGAPLAQAEDSEQADQKTSNANARPPMAEHMAMHKHMMMKKKKMHHKAM